MICQPYRVAVFCILSFIQFKLYDVILRNAGIQKIFIEQLEKQNRLSRIGVSL